MVCLVLGLLGTLPLLLLTPPFRVPDEPSHFDRAYQVSEGVFLAEVKGGAAGGMLPASLDVLTRRFLGTDAILVTSRRAQPEPLAKTLTARTISLDPGRRKFISFTGTAAYPPQAYLPQAVGIAIGRLFDAGPLILLFLARLLNALTAVTLLSLAINIMPFGWPLALLGGLLPMALYEYASASADAIVISGAFLVTALELRAFTEGRWRKWEVIVTALVGLIVCSTKPVYAPLLLIAAPAALVPGQRRNQLLALAVILLVAIGGTGLWFWADAGRTIAVNPPASIPAQTRFVVTHPFAFLSAMAVALRTQLDMYWRQMVGFLGWLTLELPAVAYQWTATGFALGLLATGRGRTRIPASVSLWWLLMFAGAVMLTMLAMYIDWSAVGAAVVGGVQGRYFIPLLALVAAIVAALPVPRIGRRTYALLFSAVSIIVLLNVIIVVARVSLAFHVLG